jgi:hypothetical protein
LVDIVSVALFYIENSNFHAIARILRVIIPSGLWPLKIATWFTCQ